MTDLSRDLAVYADDEPITGFRHSQLIGKDTIGLYPMPFTLRVWNLSSSDYFLLCAARELSVRHHGSVLASGRIADICKHPVPEGMVMEIVFAAGLELWETPVNLSVEAGASVSDTVRRILDNADTGVRLLSFPGPDPVRTRGQAFSGRAAEGIETALSAAHARCCLTPSGLCIIPDSDLPVSIDLTEADLLDEPALAGNRFLVLRTKVIGWPLGKKVSVSWMGQTAEGLVVERTVDADNMEGKWQCELLVEVSV